MCKKAISLVSLVLLAGPVLTLARGPQPIGWWSLDGDAMDRSGNANHGVLVGSPSFGQGMIGRAINLNGTSQNISVADNPSLHNFTNRLAVTAWINPLDLGNSNYYRTIVAKFGPSDRKDLYLYLDVNLGAALAGPRGNDWTPNIPMSIGTWTHVALTYDGSAMVLYKNGVASATVNVTGNLSLADASSNGPLFIGYNTSWIEYFSGLMDDVRLYNTVLTAEEILAVMKGEALELASDPRPADEGKDVPRDTTLSWTAGEYPSTHDVYVGTVFADVNSASRTAVKGVLASQSQADTTFDPPGVFAYGQTYYWRIDEVNKSPDGTIYRGNVWSFTAEPYSYPITKVTATASSAQNGMGPEKTLDGSGLTAGQHGNDPMTMWMSTGAQPNWIQYQFDTIYKLYDLKVWNSNQPVETYIGFGAKDVKIEYSTDGTTWTPLQNVPQFTKAPGVAGYAANTTVSFGGVTAKFVKLTIASTWGGMGTVTGLSEVRFSYVPVQARAPQPATVATGISISTTLNWRPGRETGAHKVFFGTEQAAVTNGTAPAKTVTDHTFDPGTLLYGTTYYWKVDEVNSVTYPGEVWSFTTQQYAVVDDFESYNDKDNCLFDTWIDGVADGKSGSQVGYNNAPFAEQTIIHGGKQSMPMEYNNVKAPYCSEATRTFDTAQNWTTSGADTLALWFRGRAAGFLDNGNNTFTLSSSGTDIWNNGDQFRFAYKQLSGDGTIVARVDSIVNTNVWAKAGVMIRQSVDTGSAHAFMPITPGGASAGNGASFQRRLTANGGSSNDDKAAPAVAAPYWVKVERKGNSFTGSISPDGKTWTQLGTAQTISMTNPVLIGLAVCSHDAAQTTVAEFSNVSLTGTVSGAWQSAAIGATMTTNGPAPLYLTVEDKAGKSKTVVNANPSASTATAWTEWRIPLSDLTDVNVAAVKRLTLGVGDKSSPKAGTAGRLYLDDIGYGHPAQ